MYSLLDTYMYVDNDLNLIPISDLFLKNVTFLIRQKLKISHFPSKIIPIEGVQIVLVNTVQHLVYFPLQLDELSLSKYAIDNLT